jgi:hypothetical protein
MRKNDTHSASYGGEVRWSSKGVPVSDVLSSFTPNFQRWIAECVYQRLPKPKDNGLDY